MRTDIVFYIKLMPLMQLHPEAKLKSEAIICAESNEKRLALLEDAFEKKSLPEACETDVIDKNIALGQSLGIHGTPSLVFQNGKKASGAPDAEDLIRFIEANQQ